MHQACRAVLEARYLAGLAAASCLHLLRRLEDEEQWGGRAAQQGCQGAGGQ